MTTVKDVLSDAKSRMEKSLEALRKELGSIRTGRANPRLVENLLVDYFGVPTPLNQLASITVPEARLLVIQPWDKQGLTTIEKGIIRSDLGLTPNNDGSVIRLTIPSLTEERRKELVRLIRKKAEEGRVAIRNVRRDSLERLRTMEKNKEMSEDALARDQEQLQKQTDSFIAQINQLLVEKEAEVMEV